MGDAIGSGGYGVVVSALPNGANTYPGNVTKLYSKKDDYDKIIALIPKLPTLLGSNAGHRMNPYRTTFLGRNLKSSVRAKLRVGPEQPVYPIRMPHLGVDITKVVDINDTSSRNAIRQCPIPILFQQIIKLLEQINRLGSYGYIHGDIRDSNIMIQPSDGTMTLIDFDWMLPVDEFYAGYGGFGFYSNPPEFLLKTYFSWMSSKSFLTMDTLRRGMPNLDPYEVQFRKQFPFIDAITPTIKNYIISANIKNFIYLQTHSFKSCLSTFDGFGLACSLLTLFYHLYPGSCHPVATLDEVKVGLETRVSKHGELYSDPELSACSKSILSLVRTVLLPMASFEIEGRLTTSVALAKAKVIYLELSKAFFPSNSMEDPVNEDGIRRRDMGHLAVLAAKAGNTSVLERLVHGKNRRTRRNKKQHIP